MGKIRVMTPVSGDKSVEWDPEDQSSVEKAKDEFKKLIDKGYKLYEVAKRTVTERKGEPVTEFDASAGEYIAVPAMAGG